ncbi:MAG: hypothetical protein ACJ8F7_13535 [Gemmataceae bacterium]
MPRRSAILRTIVTTGLILFAGAALSARAAASCGDYVRVHADQPAGHTPTLPPTKAPCHGPHCSGQPMHVPVSPPSTSPRAEQWGWLGFDLRLPPAGSRMLPLRESDIQLTTHPFRVERPPRSCA